MSRLQPFLLLQVPLMLCVNHQQDAEENLGETEVRDAMHAKATFLGKVGDREAAAAAFKETEDKTASGGSKADMVFSQIRCAVNDGVTQEHEHAAGMQIDCRTEGWPGNTSSQHS